MDAKLLQAFNKQINHDFYSAYLYFAMSTYFSEIAMQGFCDFMKHKTSEKLENAQKIYDYLILRDEKLMFSKIEEPSVDWINVSDVFTSALSHEEFILSQIKELHKIARETDDVAAMEYSSHLLNEQVKCVGRFRKLVFRIKNTNIVNANIEYLDGVINSL
ncbi:MAG: ferritin [Candidatus Gastranaerophilales bacterium]|nr:ferritin [Candidatus Gastranaerophilales bacterium]